MVESKNELAVFDEVAATIAEWKAENEKLVFEYDTPQGEKEARSHIANLRKGKTKVGEIHKKAKAESRAFGLRLDAKKNEYNGEIDGMIAVHKDPLDAIEAEKQAVIDAETKRLERAEERRLLDLEAREAAVKEQEQKAAMEKVEAERIERDKQIAEEAGERAKAKAELDAKNAAAIRETIERVRKDKEEAKEKKRIANKKHRAQVEGEILECFARMGLDVEVAIRILSAIIDDDIPHISINY